MCQRSVGVGHPAWLHAWLPRVRTFCAVSRRPRRAARAANAASLSVVVSRQPVRVAFGLRAGSFAAGIAELL